LTRNLELKTSGDRPKRQEVNRRLQKIVYCEASHARDAYRFLVRKREGKKQLGRPRHRWRIIKNMRTGLIWHRIGTSGELCVDGT
jgi:hypothetical protein